MALNAKTASGGSQKEILEVGTYPGRLVQVIDLGLQAPPPNSKFDRGPQHQIMLTYEFADEFMKDEEGNDIEDKPRWLSETFPLHNLRADKAKSTARYKSLDPNMEHDGDFAACLTNPVNISVVHNESNGRLYENVGGITPMRAKEANKLPALVNAPKSFDLDAPDVEVFKSLPEWTQKKILSNLEFNGSLLQRLLGISPDTETGPDLPGDVEDDTVPY